MQAKSFVLISFFALSFLNKPLTAQTIPTQVRANMDVFVEAFNSGDSTTILNFIKNSHHPNVLEQVPHDQLTNRLMYVYYQYGPLEPRQFEASSEKTASLWGRGKLSKAWFGFVFFFDEKQPHQILGIGVERGTLPPFEERLPPVKKSKDLGSRVNEYLDGLEGTPFFSGSVLIAKKDKIIYQRNCGLMDQRNNLMVTNDTRFPIASVSKLFVGVSILQLQERGLLKTSDFVSKFIPEYPRNIADSVTIHRLLTHTSGIELDEFEEFNSATANSIKELVDLQIRYIPQVPELLNYKLTNEYNYTNEGYALLARIVEIASGLEYWEYVRQNIFLPCGMKNTFPRPLGITPENTAIGYTNRKPEDGSYPSARLEVREIISHSIAHPAGGIISTAEDMREFSKKLFSRKLISPESLRTMSARHIATSEHRWYGYGMSILETPAGLRYGHSGDILGYNSRLDFYPESGYTVIVLSNKDQAASNAADFISELLGKN